MKRILLMEDFKNLLKKCDEVNEEDVLIRKLLNIASQKELSTEDLLFIVDLKEEIFEKAFSELDKANILEFSMIKDMVYTEYGLENLVYADIYLDVDEEDIY